MKLSHKQFIFTNKIAQLIEYAHTQGYTLTFGEAYRSPEEAERLANLGLGIKNSLHTSRLAIDLNLFKDGQYLTSSEAHLPLGLWWEQQSTSDLKFYWGGRFGDGNHYSIGHAGRK